MNYFKQEFTIHPVGHGLFYSGIMKYHLTNQKDKIFRFVFDCGSTNGKKKLDEEINNFHKIFTENEPLDLLVISHLHSDHINGIQKLLTKRNVKRVIMPFIDFKERLFLFLMAVSQNEYEIGDNDSLFKLRFILDPVSTIQEYLTEKGEIIFINSGEIKSFEKGRVNSQGDLPTIEDNDNLIFDLLPEEWHDITPSESKELKCSVDLKVKIMNDDSKLVCYCGNIPFIEFLLYRKKIDQNEIDFHKLIYNLILANFPTIININQNLANTITTFVKQSGISKAISDILENALNLTPNLKISKSKLRDLNTTSLSLLHNNTQMMYQFLDKNLLGNFYPYANVFSKLAGTANTKFDIPIPCIDGQYLPLFNSKLRFSTQIDDIFPNTLLTSDGVLLSPSDINPFLKKYQNYWLNFWLFQIPHHGSRNNIDRSLLNRIKPFVHLFINHSIKVSSRHPSPVLIREVVLAKNYGKLLSVNEFTGLKFGLLF